MNGYELFDRAILRLGYNNAVKDSLMPRAKELINQILIDLNFDILETLSDTFPQDNKVLEGVCCGLAMLLALNESDGEKHRIFCEIYNAKRSGILSKNSRVEDRLPTAEGGEN